MTTSDDKVMLDIVLQVSLVLVVGIIFLFIQNFPRNILNRIRARRNRTQTDAKCHFVRGAQLYAQARSSSMNSRSKSKNLAKQAEDEADRAISLDPTDAASHILKALTLDLQGFKSSALSSFDIALSPLASATLSSSERSDALLRRAELILSGKGKVTGLDPAIADLTKAVDLSPSNASAFSLLGGCYEQKQMKEEARKAYELALKAQPDLVEAKDALRRLD